MAQEENKCILFKETPDGTLYEKGKISWVKESVANQYINDGIAEEYDPTEQKTVQPKKKEPAEDIPDDLPGKTYFLQADITSFDKIKEMAKNEKLTTVDGIGTSTEHKIKEYLK